MSRFAFLVASLGVVALAGCSVSATDLTPTGSGSGTDDGSAVSSQALSGTIAGQSFTAVSAIRDSSGFINIYGFATTCADHKEPPAGDVGVLFTADDWTDGSAYQLSFSNSITFVKYPSSNYVSASGRVEVVSIGDKQTPGVIRIRATATDSSVNGEIAVLNCVE